MPDVGLKTTTSLPVGKSRHANATSWKPGQTGNPTGMAKGKWRQALDEALAALHKETGVDILSHATRMAYVDNMVLVALLRKLLPDLKAVEATIGQDKAQKPLTPEQEKAVLKARLARLEATEKAGDAIARN